jgi:hypothetical protein
LFALSARAALDGIDTETGRSIEAHTFLGWTFSFPRTRLRDAGPIDRAIAGLRASRSPRRIGRGAASSAGCSVFSNDGAASGGPEK